MFSSLLPPPKHSTYIKPQLLTASTIAVSSQPIKPTNSENTALVLNSDGSVNIAKTLHGDVPSSLEDTIPLKKRFPNLVHNFPRERLEDSPALQASVEETQQLINSILSPQTAKADVTYVNYTSNDLHTPRSRTIQIRTYEEDPMLPPKFKLRKNRHQQPAPPPPILKDNTEKKITKEERDKWRIPAAVSNWKNNQGFTIALDKRVGALEGSAAPEVNVEKFADLLSALELAEKVAREELQERQQRELERLEEEKKERDEQLKALSRATRMKRGRDGGDRDRKRR